MFNSYETLQVLLQAAAIGYAVSSSMPASSHFWSVVTGICNSAFGRRSSSGLASSQIGIDSGIPSSGRSAHDSSFSMMGIIDLSYKRTFGFCRRLSLQRSCSRTLSPWEKREKMDGEKDYR